MKIDTTTMSDICRARCMRLRCPACSAPIVGTKPMRFPSSARRRASAFICGVRLTISIDGSLRAALGRRLVDVEVEQLVRDALRDDVALRLGREGARAHVVGVAAD